MDATTASAARVPVGTELGAEDTPVEQRFWLRQCENGPPVLMGYDMAAWCLQQEGVVGTLETGLTYTARSTQDDRLGERTFKVTPVTVTPVTMEQALEWIRANHHSIAS